MEAQTGKAMTRHGHTISRVKKVLGMPLRLDLGVIEKHIQNVIHDITHRAAIRDVSKMIGNDAVSAAIQNAVGLDDYLQFKPWLIYNAAPPRPLDAAENMMTKFSGNMAAATLGLKITTAIGNFSSLPLAAWRLGKDWYRLLGFYANPLVWRSGYKFALKSSPELRERLKGATKEMRETYNSLEMNPLMGANKSVKKGFWVFLGLSERLISIPIWNAGYAQGMEMFGDHQKAVHHADMIK